MRKIPTLFVRDEQDRRYVTSTVSPGCEWVLAGEGEATRKYDGTCCMFDGERWWARREVKPGKVDPPGFWLLAVDEVTGKRMGWVPMAFSAWQRWHDEAVEGIDPSDGAIQPGTYELCGPKINGNPEDVACHILVRHSSAERAGWVGIRPLPGFAGAPRTVSIIQYDLQALGEVGWEGIVWHHPDGRLAKLKARDFPSEAQR